MKPFRRQEHWQVALRDGAGPFNVVQDDGGRFYADPFLHRANGRTFLFVEEYPYADKKGVISVAEVSDGQITAAPVTVLKRPYHLSYPFVFEHDGEFWMIPETGENRSVELYRAVEFPGTWELSTVLMKGAVFSDATILRHDGLWWLFATVDWFGASTQDELSIFYSETPDGEWKPHRTNPVKSDSRFSRPAGRIVQREGRLFRPAQNCDRTYGAGIAWFEITELTPISFNERHIADWDGQTELSMDGLHSFDQLGSLQVIDFKHPVYRGAARKHLTTIKPRHGGELERSFSKSSYVFK
ncbi:MAG: glucosamine inositolphosphorylceramide transferase family protein [Xanthobacteraceae bacterium]